MVGSHSEHRSNHSREHVFSVALRWTVSVKERKVSTLVNKGLQVEERLERGGSTCHGVILFFHIFLPFKGPPILRREDRGFTAVVGDFGLAEKIPVYR